MEDLNDLYYFAAVVDHGGFAAAGRALGLPKSRLSRRIALLEEHLGARLLQRSSRQFAVTEAGRILHRHCLAVLAEARAAREAIEQTRTEPQGTLRLSCPVSLIPNRVAPLVTRFLADYPRVRIELDATNRRVDVIDEGYDLAIRVRMPPLDDSDLVVRVLESHGAVLVAGRPLLERLGHPRAPGDLADFPSLDMMRFDHQHHWRLTSPDGGEQIVRIEPRLITDDMTALRQAAIDGVGAVELPWFMVAEPLEQGTLERLLPEWTPPAGILHVVFPSRRGLVPAVRAFIDRLAETFAQGCPLAVPK